MDVLDAVRGRRTVRSYEARRPDRRLIEALIWDAAQAPPAPREPPRPEIIWRS